MNTQTPRKGPLEGQLILDLTQFLAGPYGTQILGDLGARIIKIEAPEGDGTRRLPPHFHKGDSAYYLSVNRNKESLTLDLKTERGREIFLKLVEQADTVLENFRPGVAERLGINFEVLRKVNPNIVMCAISGFGQDGPYRDLQAYDIIVQAMSGGMSITGERGGAPVRAGIPLGDLCAGMFCTIGVLAHLTKDRASRTAQYIDISMLDCQVSMLSYQAAYYLYSGQVPGPQGRAHESIPTYRAFRCADDVEIVVAANTEAMWKSLCTAIGLPQLAADERFALNRDRLKNRHVLEPMLEAAFRELPSAVVLKRFVEHNVPAGPINDLAAALTDPQVLHRGMVMEIDDGSGGSIKVAGNPIKLAGQPVAAPGYPPKLGSGNYPVLSELLGLSEDELHELSAQKIIGPTAGEPAAATKQTNTLAGIG